MLIIFEVQSYNKTPLSFISNLANVSLCGMLGHVDHVLTVVKITQSTSHTFSLTIHFMLCNRYVTHAQCKGITAYTVGSSAFSS